MPRMFLADPSLIGFSGHCFSYLQSLVPEAVRRGFEPVLVGHHVCDPKLVEAYRMWPLFRDWCDARYGTKDETRGRHEANLLDELRRLGRERDVTSADVVILNTLRHWSIRSVPAWLEELPADRRPWVVLVLHFTAFPDPTRSDGTVDMYREAFTRIADSPARDRIQLLADADELAAEYRATFPGLEYRVAPIPHAHPMPVRPLGERIRVGYLGEARQNKGFDLLPRMVHTAVADPELADVDFHLHAFIHHPEAEWYRRAMAGVRHPRVTTYPHQMPEDEYNAFVESLDVVLIPYVLDNYHSQTSGVFAEAAAAGKLTVVPKGSWMARQAARYGGGVAFNPGDVEDFALVSCRLLRQARQMQQGAGERADAWREFHNPERFLDVVLFGHQRSAVVAA